MCVRGGKGGGFETKPRPRKKKPIWIQLKDHKGIVTIHTWQSSVTKTVRNRALPQASLERMRSFCFSESSYNCAWPHFEGIHNSRGRVKSIKGKSTARTFESDTFPRAFKRLSMICSRVARGKERISTVLQWRSIRRSGSAVVTTTLIVKQSHEMLS